MKSIRYILLLLILPMLTFSQLIQHYSLYIMNDVIINPSLISTKSENQVALMIRDQWTGFEGSPKTQLLSYQRKQGDKIGLGATIINDATGPISRTVLFLLIFPILIILSIIFWSVKKFCPRLFFGD